VCSYNWVAREEFNLPGIGSVDDFTEQVRFWRIIDLNRRFPNGGFSCSKIPPVLSRPNFAQIAPEFDEARVPLSFPNLSYYPVNGFWGQVTFPFPRPKSHRSW
jgi:hypothetical protein